jgi:hypothetical protein
MPELHAAAAHLPRKANGSDTARDTRTDEAMTARAIIPPATLRAAALDAKANGVVVTITMPDGTTCTVAPATNAGHGDPFELVEMKR